MTKFWVGVVSKEHVQRGVKGGFCQVCHGKKGPLNRMKKEITYSTIALNTRWLIRKNYRLLQRLEK